MSQYDEAPMPSGNVEPDNALPASNRSNETDETKLAKLGIQPIKKIGAGAFGNVYQATVPPSIVPGFLKDKKIAIKMLQNTDHKKLFTEECKLNNFICKKANQNHSIHLSVPYPEENPVLLMSEVKKGSVEELYESAVATQQEWLTPESMRTHFQEMKKAVDDFHAIGLIHRDIAARNFLLDDNGKISINDFGLTKRMDERGQFIGREAVPFALRWIAKENMTENLFSRKTDLHMLAMTYIEMLEIALDKRQGQGLNYTQSKYLGKPVNPTEWATHLYKMGNPRDALHGLLNVLETDAKEFEHTRGYLPLIAEVRHFVNHNRFELSAISHTHNPLPTANNTTNLGAQNAENGTYGHMPLGPVYSEMPPRPTIYGPLPIPEVKPTSTAGMLKGMNETGRVQPKIGAHRIATQAEPKPEPKPERKIPEKGQEETPPPSPRIKRGLN